MPQLCGSLAAPASPDSALLQGVVITLAASSLFTFLSRPLALKLRVIDAPAALKIHRESIPRLGGLGIFVGLLSGALLSRSACRELLVGALLIFIVGAIDDRWNITPIQKLSGQAIAGAVLWFVIASSYPGSVGIIYGFVGFVLALLMSNAVNLIDGMNGLASGNTLLMFLALSVLEGLHRLNYDFTLLIGVAIFGFLPFNFPKARTFMGDSGSLLIGYLLAFALVQLLVVNFTLFVCGLTIVMVPIYDLGLGILRRLIARRPIFGADRGHFYDRINSWTRNVTITVLITYVSTAMLSAIAIRVSFGGLKLAIAFALMVMMLFVVASTLLGWLQPAHQSERT